MLEYEKYERMIQENIVDEVYEELYELLIEKAKYIFKIKNIEYNFSKEKKQVLHDIQYDIKSKSYCFSCLGDLAKELENWNVRSEKLFEDDEFKNIELETAYPSKTKDFVECYNYLENEIEKFLKIKQDIENRGYKKVLKENQEKIISLFKEMLDYKNKKYDENWDFMKFLEIILYYYCYFKYEIIFVIDTLKYGKYQFSDNPFEKFLILDEEEIITILQSFYKALIDEKLGYKKCAFMYRDYDLKEGQTTDELITEKQNKLKKLFKEMLNLKNAICKETDSFGILELRVAEVYPEYKHLLKDSFIDFEEEWTDVEVLNNLDDMYEILKGYEKEKIGFTIGKFAPLHKGHQYLIEKGLAEMDKFYVLIYETKAIDTPIEKRANWIKELYPNANIIYALNPPSKYGLDEESIKIQTDYIKELIKEIKVTHFYSSEPYGKFVARDLGIEEVLVDKKRVNYPVSATAIRGNLGKFEKYLEKIVLDDLK